MLNLKLVIVSIMSVMNVSDSYLSFLRRPHFARVGYTCWNIVVILKIIQTNYKVLLNKTLSYFQNFLIWSMQISVLWCIHYNENDVVSTLQLVSSWPALDLDYSRSALKE